MFRRVLAVLLLIPLLDALFLAFVATRIGWAVTVLLVVLTALVGMLLVRAEGRHAVARLQRTVERGEVPTGPLLDGALLVAAGAFLLTPGLVTDLVGFLLALPPTRYPIRTVLWRWVVLPSLDRRTEGFATGRVYTGGFPEEDTYDVDPDGYRIDFEDEG